MHHSTSQTDRPKYAPRKKEEEEVNREGKWVQNP